MEISDLVTDDLVVALALNNAAAPAVNVLDLDELARLHAMAAHALAVRVDGRPDLAGFCVTFDPGADYRSLNYTWFGERYDSFTYLDRIVVSPTDRGRGLGAALYAALEQRIAGRTPWLCCEVNIRPMNEGSLRFHQRLGFREVGRQDTDRGTKTVSLLAKAL